MSNLSTRPPRGAAQARFFRLVNVPMRWVLSLPFPTPLGKRLMLVHHVGRRSGKSYRQPVSYVRRGDSLLTPGGGNWTRNLRQGELTHIRLEGRDITARPELVSDAGEVEQLLDFMTTANPTLKRFIPIPRTAGGRLDPQSLARAIEGGFRIVRWVPS